MHLRPACRSIAAFALCVALATIMLSGCGGSTPERVKHNTSGVVPRDAAVIVTADVRRSERGQLRTLDRALRRVPAWSLVRDRVPTAEDLVDDLRGSLDGEGEVTWYRDIRPWIGDQVGAAAWVDDPKSADAMAWIIWVDVRLGHSPRRALRRLLGSRSIKEYHGYQLHRARHARAWWSVVDDRIVMSERVGWLRASIDAHTSDALEQQSTYRSALKMRDGHHALASVVVMPAAWSQLGKLLQADTSSHIADGVRAELDRQTEQMADSGTISLHIGATSGSVWIDAVSNVAGAPKDPVIDGAAMRRVEGLPAASLFAYSNVTRRNGVPAAERLAKLRVRIGELTARSSSPFAQLVQTVVDSTALVHLHTALGDDQSVVVLERDGHLALGGELQLASAAEYRIAQPQLQRLLALLVRQIPRAQIAESLGDQATHPAIVQLLDPDARVGQRIARRGDSVAFAFPAQSIDLIPESRSRGATLQSNEHLARDMAALTIPDDVTTLTWIDVQRLVQVIIDPLDGRVRPLVDGQLDHVGGPVIWSTARAANGGTEHRISMEIPLYE